MRLLCYNCQGTTNVLYYSLYLRSYKIQKTIFFAMIYGWLPIIIIHDNIYELLGSVLWAGASCLPVAQVLGKSWYGRTFRIN